MSIESRTLAVGARAVVTLPGLGAAGYRWSATVDDPALVSVERVALPSGPDASPPGASRDEAFALLGLAVGETTARFVQARSFEPGRPPHAVREMRIRVTPESGS